MRLKRLIDILLNTNARARQHALIKANSGLIDLGLARKLKDTYYDSWTTAPQRTRNAATALEIVIDFVPLPEVTALANWVRGIADLTDGKLENAVDSLDRAASVFAKIGLEHDAAQTKVAKLIALALLGKYDEAVRTGKQALAVYKRYGDELAAGKVEKNLGNIMARRGNERAAEQYYLAARKRFVKLKNKSELAMCDNSLANTYAETNSFRQAEIYYAKALSSAQQAHMSVTEAEIEASMGNLALFRGKLDEALRYLELSRQKFDELGMPHQTAIAELEIADIYLEINLVDEAFVIYRKVSDSLSRLKLRGEEARARANFGRAAMAKNLPRKARAELGRSYELYRAEKSPAGAAHVKLIEIDLEIKQKNYAAAAELVREAKTLLAKHANPRPRILADWLHGEVLRNLRRTKPAERILVETLKKANEFEQSGLAQTCLVSLGRLALQRDDWRDAENYFARAVKLIETMRAPLAADEFRMTFLANKLAPFEALAGLYLKTGRLRQAFLTIEKAKARTLSENLDGTVRPKRGPATHLEKELDGLREELNWFYSRLNRAEPHEIRNIWQEVNRRETKITTLLRRVDSLNAKVDTKAGRKNALRGRDVLESVQNSLGDQRALVEFVTTDGKISALVVRERTIDLVSDVSTETEVHALLDGFQFQLDALRYGTTHLGPFIPALKKRADHYLQSLYEHLLRPLEDFVGGGDLVIVPTGVLHYVPFHGLHDGKSYVVEKRCVRYAPSATVWSKLRQMRSRPVKSSLVMAFADERIPLVENEVAAIRRTLAGAKSFVGRKATFRAFSDAASGADLIHLACHGQFRPDRPMFSSLHLADGWVTVRDLVAKRMSAELVTLSACETGISDVFAGEELLGLTRGFLSAGARSLIVSLWAINDKAAQEIMPLLYKRMISGLSPAEALRKVQSDAISRGLHPALWAPFLYIGG